MSRPKNRPKRRHAPAVPPAPRPEFAATQAPVGPAPAPSAGPTSTATPTPITTASTPATPPSTPAPTTPAPTPAPGAAAPTPPTAPAPTPPQPPVPLLASPQAETFLKVVFGGVLLLVPIAVLVKAVSKHEPEGLAAVSRLDPGTPNERHLVTPEPRFQGNGFPVFTAALAKTNKPSVAARQDLVALLQNPHAPLSIEGLRYARDSWPAIKELEHAVCSESFARTGSDGGAGLDVERLQLLTVSALAVARIQSGTRAAPGVGRWSVRAIRLGYMLAKDAPFPEAAGALALARCGERWLKDALEKRDWSEDELNWLRDELDAVAVRRGQLEVGAKETGKAAEGLKKAAAAEQSAFDEVKRLANAPRPRRG